MQRREFLATGVIALAGIPSIDIEPEYYWVRTYSNDSESVILRKHDGSPYVSIPTLCKLSEVKPGYIDEKMRELKNIVEDCDPHTKHNYYCIIHNDSSIACLALPSEQVSNVKELHV